MFSVAEWESIWQFQTDKVLLTLTAVLAGAGALVCLVVAWATTSRCHWFWRAASVLAVLGLFVPPRAFEPLLFFATVAVVQATGVYLLNRLRSGLLVPRTGVSSKPSGASRWSFQIRDLLLLMILIGVVLSAVPVFRTQELYAKWDGFLVPALAIATIAVAAMVLVCRPRFKRCWLAFVAAVIVATALHISGNFDFLLIDLSFDYSNSTHLNAVVIVSYLQRYILFACLLLSGLAVMRVLAVRKTSRRASAAIVVVAGCLSLLAVAPAGWIYWQMTRPLPVAITLHFVNNPFDRIHTCALEMQRLNPGELSVKELQATAGAATARQVSDFNGELLDLLATPGHVPLELPRDAKLNSFYKTGHPQAYRSLARTWSAESKEAANAGQPDVACRYARATIQFGGDLTRGGTLVHTAVGFAVEGVGAAELVAVHRDISLAEARRTIETLEQRQSLQEAPSRIHLRDRVIDEIILGWRTRLRNATHDLWGRAPSFSLSRFFHRGNVQFHLLRISLALRHFEHDRGKLPQTLSELAPEYLREVPLDPYSNQPFVYRIAPNGHLLYSVGPDRIDNGGNFATWKEAYQSGFDVDVDISTR